MKNLKSVLAVLSALCLMMCLAVPVFATGETTAPTTPETTAAIEETTAPVEETTAPVEETTAPTEDTTTTGTVEDEHDHAAETEPVSGTRKVVRTIVIVLEVITSIALVVIVLVQSGKEAGLSGAISGNSDSYMSKGKRASLDKKLASATKWVALAWVVLTLILSLI